jgi:hypothetical protein
MLSQYLKRCLKILVVLCPLMLVSTLTTQSSIAEVGFATHDHFAKATIMADNAMPLSNVFRASPLANPLLAQTSNVGQWSSPWQLSLVTIHAAMLTDGKLLVWDREETSTNLAKVIDPINRTVTSVPYGSASLFCAGHALLQDGRVALFGGHINADYYGINQFNIFNPSTRSWSRGPNMAYARWYPTSITLSDGRILVVGGSITPTSFATIPEIYNPATNSWTQLNNASLRADYYPKLYQYPNNSNRVFLTGANDGYSYYLDLTNGRWTRIGSGHGGMSSSSVMYLPGKIMWTGLGNRTFVIDLNQSNPTWRETAPMAYSRTYLTLTILPDGKVLATGGSDDGSNDPAHGVLQAEMWNPSTEKWSQLTPMQNPRMYHSLAALLPDGRVFVSGGGHGAGAPVAYFNAEYYSPAYLFKGSRPTISSAPSSANYSQTITVQTPNASSINSVSLISLPSVTHAWNENQRFLPLSFTRGSGSLSVNIPSNRNTTPPGYYMLFILNSSGVPSTARVIQISGSGSSPTPTPPPPTATPTPTPTPVTPTPPPGTNTTITVQINQPGNDANEDGTTYDASYQGIWLGNATSTSASFAGLRFTNVTVPRGRTIVSAQLQVYAPMQAQTGPISFQIAGEASGNSAAFSTANKPSQRVLTTARVQHTSNNTWNANTWYTLADISTIISEVSNRSDWNSGNSLSLILRGTGSANQRKWGASFEYSPSFAVRLVITYR